METDEKQLTTEPKVFQSYCLKCECLKMQLIIIEQLSNSFILRLLCINCGGLQDLPLLMRGLINSVPEAKPITTKRREYLG